MVVAANEVLPFAPFPDMTLWVSVTISENVSVVAVGPPAGAVNVGFCAVGSDNVTAGPPVWVQAYEIG